MLRYVLRCVACVAGLGMTMPAIAVDYFWTNTNGGAFDEPSHWAPFAPPAMQGPGGASDTVNFDLGVVPTSRYVVTDAGRENSQLIVHDDSIEVTIFVGHELVSVGGANPSLVVGAATGDTGDLILSSGGASILQTRVTSIGDAAGSTGILTVDNLEWVSLGNIRVGHEGDGTLTIQGNSEVSSANVFIANRAGSSGEVNLIVDSTWTTSGDVVVGRLGDGWLTIDYRGSITSANGVLGQDAVASGVVYVNNGAAWTMTDSLIVGDEGSGLFANTRGDVICHDAFIAQSPGSSGQAYVSNDGSTWSVTGRLSIGGDAFTGIAGGVALAQVNPSASLTVAEDIVIFPNGRLVLNRGSLDTPIITMEPGSLFDWTGGELFVDTFQGSLTNNNGTLAAREGSNSLLVSDDYSQGPDGVLKIGIAGDPASNEFDSMIVGGTAFLGGLLQVDLAEGFQPESDDVYTIVDALNLGGNSFTNAANGERLFLDLSGGSFVVNYGLASPFDPSQVVLSDFQPAATGDFDNDGDVDGRDFLIWQRGGSFNPLSATDLAVWQANYGPVPFMAYTAAVPEPSSGGAAFCLVVALSGRRKKRLTPSLGVP